VIDEMTHVRELYAETAPDPRVESALRGRLDDVIRGRTPRRRRRPVVAAAWLAMPAAAAATALIVAFGSGQIATPGGQATGPGGHGSAGVSSAQSVLLAAASAAESSPTGRYWHTKEVHVDRRGVEVGSRGNRYRVGAGVVTERWVAHDGRSWVGTRPAGYRPLTAGDRAAWKRDGSPTTWEVRQPNGHVVHLSAVPGKGELLPATKDKTYFDVYGKMLTYDQVRSLPTDPVALRAWADSLSKPVELLERADGSLVPKGNGNAGAGEVVVLRPSKSERAFRTAATLAALLHDAPASPQLRAAAFRALAGLPNVQNLGPRRDASGRQGVGVLFEYRSSLEPRGGGHPGRLAIELIIDPATSKVLADAIVADPESPNDNRGNNYSLVDVEVTDTVPHVPDLP
jgi:hypothetical protein